MKRHNYGKFNGAWCVYALNGHIIASGINSEQVAQRIAKGLDLELIERRGARK